MPPTSPRMRLRAQVRAAGAVAACLLACAPTALGQSDARVGTTSSAAPSRLLVTASEWRLTLSRAAVRPGAAVVQLQNLGEDAHDLRARRIQRSRVAGGSTPAPAMASPETPSGGLSEVEISLRPGRYRLWCSLPGHRQAGMQATLQVRRNPRPR